MPKKVVVILAAAAVVVLLLWARKRATQQQQEAATAYDPPLRPSPGADVASLFSGVAGAASNWVAQWFDYGAARAGEAVSNVIPIPQAEKPKSFSNTQLQLVTTPQYGQR